MIDEPDNRYGCNCPYLPAAAGAYFILHLKEDAYGQSGGETGNIDHRVELVFPEGPPGGLKLVLEHMMAVNALGAAKRMPFLLCAVA